MTPPTNYCLPQYQGYAEPPQKKENKESRNFRKQSAGDATYSVAVFGGEKLFQIQTYGSPDRQSKGIASQVIQFYKEQAINLIKILQKEFNL